MLFSRSSLQHAAGPGRPSVLALYSDDFIGEVRIRPMLNALLARGIIDDYQIADRKMELAGPIKQHRFTHIWCQRNVSTRQFSFLKQHKHVPIIYDLDDLLTSPPEFVISTRSRTTNRIEWCLRNAKAVTVTSARLATALREDVPSMTRNVVVVKNGCASEVLPKVRAPQKIIVWASGDRPYMLKDDPTFIERVAQLANREGYQAVFIGRFENDNMGLFADVRHIPHLDFVSYREFLRSCAGGIGLAPLPTRLAERSQRYFDAKSDIKLVDFLVSGLLPLCTAAVPYVTSDLFVEPLAGANPNELIEKLAATMADPAAMQAYAEEIIYRPQLLQPREFTRLSMALDRFFV